MKDPLNGSPPWVRLLAIFGLPTFLLLWILGGFGKVIPSPVTSAIEAHDRETTRIQRMICRGVWRGDELAQRDCER